MHSKLSYQSQALQTEVALREGLPEKLSTLSFFRTGFAVVSRSRTLCFDAVSRVVVTRVQVSAKARGNQTVDQILLLTKSNEDQFRIIGPPRVLRTVQNSCPACKCRTRCVIEVKVRQSKTGDLFNGQYVGCAGCGERSEIALHG